MWNNRMIALALIMFSIWLIESIIIIIVANALTDIIGLHGLGKYCCIFLLWIITVGVINKLQKD